MSYTVLSPDGVPIGPRTYRTIAEADAALTKWCRRFAEQGFYSSAVAGRIALADLPARCRIIENTEDDK